MKNKNTMALSSYIFNNLYFAILAVIHYQNCIFICFSNWTYNDSRLLCWGILAWSVLIGIIFTFKRQRNNLSVFVNIFFGLGLYSFFAYYKYFENLIIISLFIALILTLAYAIIIMRKKINFKNKNFHNNKIFYSFKVRSKHIFLGSRTIFAICMAVLLVPFSIKCLFEYSLFQAQVSAEYYCINDEYTIENQIDELVKFDESTWINLTLQEKLVLMQIAANIEANYLGISHELNVVSITVADNVYGYYDYSKHLIVVNTTILENSNAYDVLETVCHEAYHAYQYQQVILFNQLDEESQSLLMFYEISLYKAEFEGGYIDGTDDFAGYYMQTCEVNAREYADEAVRSYKYWVNYYDENLAEQLSN